MPQISVIIPTWNQSQWTIKCLAALKKHSSNPIHVIWIDNGSTKQEHEIVVPHMKKFHWDYEYHPKPLGFPKAINRGLKHTKSDWTVMLNNDCEVTPGWDTELMKALQARPGAAGPIAIQSGGWQAHQYHPWLRIPAGMKDRWHIHRHLRGTWAGTFKDVPAKATQKHWRGMLAFFCTMFQTSILSAVGGLDESFGLGFGEDDDYCMRLRRARKNITLCPGAGVFHALSRTMANIPGGVNKQMGKSRALLKQKWGRTS